MPGDTGDAEGWRELKSREEIQTIQSYVFGGERMMGLWTLSGQVGYSQSRERNPGGISGATFEGDFADAGFSSSRKPRLTVDSAFYDPASFELDEVEWEKSDTRDREKNIRPDWPATTTSGATRRRPSSAASSAADTRTTTARSGSMTTSTT